MKNTKHLILRAGQVISGFFRAVYYSLDKFHIKR